MFQLEFMRRAFLVGIMLSIVIPCIGVVMVNKRNSMIGEALSHVSLAGVTIGLIFRVNPIITAIISCAVASFSIEIMRRYFPKNSDISTAIIMSLGIGLAAVLSDFVKGAANFNSFLFGSIVAISDFEVILVTMVFFIVIAVFAILYKALLYVSFDEVGARLAGIRVQNVNIIFTFFEIYLMYTIFSINSLAREGKKVYKILQKGNLEIARKELSYLVSRDTEKMDKIMIIRSTMETISENTVDGIIAPMFYMFIGGLPLAMTYKAINTMDSMVGYKNEKYIDFGKFSAKVDDIANFIPARITGILIIISSFLLGFDYKNAKKIFFRDRKNHSSPNSAHSEASVAGALGVQFGGKVSYFGKEVEKPTIGDKKKEFRTEDIRKNIRIMYVTSFVGLVIFSLIRFIIFKIL